MTDLGFADDLVLYIKGGVHGTELAYRLLMMSMTSLAVRRPAALRAFGIGGLVTYDANPVITDENTWHIPKNPGMPTLMDYLIEARRGSEEIDTSPNLQHFDDLSGHQQGAVAVTNF